MRELTQDPFYELINEQYSRCIIDYCLIAPDMPYRGIRSHREAVLFAMLKMNVATVSTVLVTYSFLSATRSVLL